MFRRINKYLAFVATIVLCAVIVQEGKLNNNILCRK